VEPPRKHVIDASNSYAGNAGVQNIDLVVGAINPDPVANFTNVKAFNIVPHIDLMLEIIRTTISTPTNCPVDWYIWFNINGAQTAPTPGTTMGSVLVNQVFHEDQALLVQPGAVGDTGFAQKAAWHVPIRVPRSWRTINQGDKIQVKVSSPGGASDNFKYKIKAIYKEYYP